MRHAGENIIRNKQAVRDGFGDLVKAAWVPLVTFLRRYVADDGAADDLAQESLVKAWRHLDDFDDRRAFEPWLFTIAANLARDHLRRRSAHPPHLPLLDEDAAIDDAPPDGGTAASHEELEHAIGSLPDGLREPPPPFLPP